MVTIGHHWSPMNGGIQWHGGVVNSGVTTESNIIHGICHVVETNGWKGCSMIDY